ncbi:MAG: hypothetical protein MJA83_19050, partial [Gammaproteobacteria bacterium]|nr:hypothetical protein [Gammaproteobacteria bacterium]
MRAIGLVLSAAIFMFSTTVASSEMPERLKGSWILNAGATENFMRTSPKWGPDAEKYLPRILERMSHYMFEFEDGVITASGQVKRNTMSAMLKEHDAETYVFESTQG